MDYAAKSSSGLENAIVPVDGANTPKNTRIRSKRPRNTRGKRSLVLLGDMNQLAHVGDKDGLDVVEAPEGGGGGGSSSRQRKYARLSQEQIDHLETLFQQNQFPDTKTKEELANRIGMTLHKVHVWFQARRARFNQMNRDAAYKEQIKALTDEVKLKTDQIKVLSEHNALLTEQLTPMTRNFVSLCERVSSLAVKGMSAHEQNSSLTQENYRLQSELAEIKAAMPPVMLPIHGLPNKVFVELCRVCSPIFRDTAAAGGALPGSQEGSASASASASSSASTSTAKLCRDCLFTMENIKATATFAQRRGSD